MLEIKIKYEGSRSFLRPMDYSPKTSMFKKMISNLEEKIDFHSLSDSSKDKIIKGLETQLPNIKNKNQQAYLKKSIKIKQDLLNVSEEEILKYNNDLLTKKTELEEIMANAERTAFSDATIKGILLRICGESRRVASIPEDDPIYDLIDFEKVDYRNEILSENEDLFIARFGKHIPPKKIGGFLHEKDVPYYGFFDSFQRIFSPIILSEQERQDILVQSVLKQPSPVTKLYPDNNVLKAYLTLEALTDKKERSLVVQAIYVLFHQELTDNPNFLDYHKLTHPSHANKEISEMKISGIAPTANASITTKEAFKSIKKVPKGNPMTSLLRKGILTIYVDVSSTEKDKIIRVIENAGVALFHVGKKGRAFISDIF